MSVVAVLVLLGILLAGFTPPEDSQDKRQIQRRCRILLKSSMKAYQESRYEEAMKGLDEVLSCDPANPDGFYWRGKTFLAQADTTGAVETLAAGAVAAPLSSRIKLLLARIRLGEGNLAEASDLVAAVLAFKPHEGEALYLRGLVHLAKGDTTIALDDWTLSVESALEKRRR